MRTFPPLRHSVYETRVLSHEAETRKRRVPGSFRTPELRGYGLPSGSMNEEQSQSVGWPSGSM